jgi:hypothetical protein
MREPIVTLKVIAVFQQTKEVEITVRIGRAAPQDDAWMCLVELAPIYAEPMQVKGVDAFHATWLACSLVLRLLGQLKQEGAALRSADGSEFPVDAYLAGLGGGDAAGG